MAMQEASISQALYQGSSDSSISSHEELPALPPLFASPAVSDLRSGAPTRSDHRSLSMITKDHALTLVGAIKYTVLQPVWRGRPAIRQTKHLLPPPAGPYTLPRFNHAGTMHFDANWYSGPTDRCNVIFLRALVQMVEETVVSIFLFAMCKRR